MFFSADRKQYAAKMTNQQMKVGTFQDSIFFLKELFRITSINSVIDGILVCGNSKCVTLKAKEK